MGYRCQTCGYFALSISYSICVHSLILSLDGSCKYSADYEADFDALGTDLVRTYSSHECNTAEQILPAAAKKGVKVILGVWYVAFYCFSFICNLGKDSSKDSPKSLIRKSSYDTGHFFVPCISKLGLGSINCFGQTPRANRLHQA